MRVPTVYRELCTRRLLVQEQFEGVTVADTAALERSASTATMLAEKLVRSMLDQVLRIGFFHADPHPGNVFVFADGTLGLIDFGAVGRLDPIQQSAVIDIMFAPRPTRRRPAARRRRAGRRRRRDRVRRASWNVRSPG